MTDKELDLDAVEALCDGAHASELGRLIPDRDDEDSASIYYGDGDTCAAIWTNLGSEYTMQPWELARLFAEAPVLIPALVAELRAERARVGDWVSVDDRLPSVGDEIIIAYEGGEMWSCIRQPGDDFSGHVPNVTHWRPLPAPPQGQEE